MKWLDAGKRGPWLRAAALLLWTLLGAACSSGDGGDDAALDLFGGNDSGGSSGQGGASPGSAAAAAQSTSGSGGQGGSDSGGVGNAGSSIGGADRGGTGGSLVSEEDGGRSGGRAGAPRGGRAGASSGGTSGQGTAGSSTGGMSPGEDQEGELAGTLEAHNLVRAMVEDSDPLPPLTWSDELAEFAQEWADTLAAECETIYHRQQSSYGENIAARWSFGNQSTEPYGPDAVEAWAAEIECWEFGSITGLGVQGTERCDMQCIQAQNSSGCGHYTQLVWRTTKQVGCGYASCDAGNRRLMEIAVCNYDPPGNYVGREPY